VSRMPQPSCSSDSVPSNFSLFSTVENRVERAHTADGDDLFEQLLKILHVIPVDELERSSAA
jgi:hypothetical protein